MQNMTNATRITLVILGIVVIVIAGLFVSGMLKEENTADFNELKIQTQADVDGKKVENLGAYERNSNPKSDDHSFFGKDEYGRWIMVADKDGKPVFYPKMQPEKKGVTVRHYTTITTPYLPPTVEKNDDLEKSTQYTDKEVGKLKGEMQEGFNGVNKRIDETNENMNKGFKSMEDLIKEQRQAPPKEEKKSDDDVGSTEGN